MSALDRRTFMGAAAAVSAVSLLPVSLGAAATTQAVNPQLLADWSIDDMWGVYPRYADAIAYGHPATDRDVAVDPLDAQFLA